MGWPKGTPRPKGAGRKKGTPNKTTATVKAALTEAFDELGGVPALVKWGRANESLFYPLWVRIAPHELDVTSNGKTLEALVAASIRDTTEPS
jgi:hypothetical protein